MTKTDEFHFLVVSAGSSAHVATEPPLNMTESVELRLRNPLNLLSSLCAVRNSGGDGKLDDLPTHSRKRRRSQQQQQQHHHQEGMGGAAGIVEEPPRTRSRLAHAALPSPPASRIARQGRRSVRAPSISR